VAGNLEAALRSGPVPQASRGPGGRRALRKKIAALEIEVRTLHRVIEIAPADTIERACRSPGFRAGARGIRGPAAGA